MSLLFRIVVTIWWWSEIPTYTVQDFLKTSFLLVRIKSMQDELLHLKYFGVFVKFSKLKAFVNKLRFLFSIVKLKSPRSIKLS